MRREISDSPGPQGLKSVREEVIRAKVAPWRFCYALVLPFTFRWLSEAYR